MRRGAQPDPSRLSALPQWAVARQRALPCACKLHLPGTCQHRSRDVARVAPLTRLAGGQWLPDRLLAAAQLRSCDSKALHPLPPPTELSNSTPSLLIAVIKPARRRSRARLERKRALDGPDKAPVTLVSAKRLHLLFFRSRATLSAYQQAQYFSITPSSKASPQYSTGSRSSI